LIYDFYEFYELYEYDFYELCEYDVHLSGEVAPWLAEGPRDLLP
jgi:hypothetical protein